MNWHRPVRVLLWSAGSLILIFLISVTLLILLFPADEVRLYLSRKLSEKTGVAVSIGSVSAVLSGRIEIRDVSVGNFLTVGSVSAYLLPWKLPYKKAELLSVRVDDFRLRISSTDQTTPAGNPVWRFPGNLFRKASEPERIISNILAQKSDEPSGWQMNLRGAQVRNLEVQIDPALEPVRFPAGVWKGQVAYRLRKDGFLADAELENAAGRIVTQDLEILMSGSGIGRLNAGHIEFDSASPEAFGIPLKSLSVRVNIRKKLHYDIEEASIRHARSPFDIRLKGDVKANQESGDEWTSEKLNISLTGKSAKGGDIQLRDFHWKRGSLPSAGFSGTLQLAALGAGLSGGEVQAQGRFASGVPVEISGTVKDLKWKGLLELRTGSFRKLGGQLVVESNEAIFAGIRSDIVASLGKDKIETDIRIPDLDIPLFLSGFRAGSKSEGAENAEAEKTPSSVPFTVEGKLSTSLLHYNSLKLSDLRSTFSIGKDRSMNLNLNNVILAGGRINGTYTLSPALEQSFRLQASGVRLQEIMEMMQSKGRIYSVVSMSASGSMKGQDLKTIEETLSGEVTLTAGTGRASDTFVQRGMLSGILAPLEKRLLDVEFSELKLQLRQSAGIVTIRKAAFIADQWSLNLKGESDWSANGEIGAELRFTDQFIADVANPVSLGIGDTRIGPWYTLPFRCEGQLRESRCWRPEW